ncbi:MAG: HD-GYP domain-containing protein, partial [Bdellovibrionota bacterium]
YLFLRKDFVLPICQRLQPEVIKGLPVEIPKAPATVVIPPDDDVDRARRLEELKAKARALAGKREELLASKEGPPPKVTQNDEALQKKVQDILAARAAAAAPPPPAPPPLALTAAEKRAEAARLFEKDLGGALDSVQEMGQRLGFTEEVQKATRTHVLETIAAVKSTPRLSAILGQLRRDQEKYISSHSMLLAHVSCALATQIDWKSDTTFQKLTLAAFLHDISIKNQALARIDSLKELERERSRFTDTEVKTFKLHPIAGAEIAKNFKEIPPDVDAIIIQHHERPDGSGFPRGLNNIRIGPLATVFIVAHDLVDFLFETDSESLDSLDLDEFVQRNAKTYQFINFRKVLSAIPKLKG